MGELDQFQWPPDRKWFGSIFPPKGWALVGHPNQCSAKLLNKTWHCHSSINSSGVDVDSRFSMLLSALGSFALGTPRGQKGLNLCDVWDQFAHVVGDHQCPSLRPIETGSQSSSKYCRRPGALCSHWFIQAKKHLHMIFSDGFSESFLIKKSSNSEWRGAARGLLILSAHPELFSEVCVPTKLEPDILGGSMAAPLVSVFQSTEDQWHDHSQGWCLNLCPRGARVIDGNLIDCDSMMSPVRLCNNVKKVCCN